MTLRSRTSSYLLAVSFIFALLISGSGCYSYGSQSTEEELGSYEQAEQIPNLRQFNYLRSTAYPSGHLECVPETDYGYKFMEAQPSCSWPLLLQKIRSNYAPTERQVEEQPLQYGGHPYEYYEPSVEKDEQPEEHYEQSEEHYEEPEEQYEEQHEQLEAQYEQAENQYDQPQEEPEEQYEQPEEQYEQPEEQYEQSVQPYQQPEEQDGEYVNSGGNAPAPEVLILKTRGTIASIKEGTGGAKEKTISGITPTTKKVTSRKITGRNTPIKKKVTCVTPAPKHKTTNGITHTTKKNAGVTLVTTHKTTGGIATKKTICVTPKAKTTEPITPTPAKIKPTTPRCNTDKTNKATGVTPVTTHKTTGGTATKKATSVTPATKTKTTRRMTSTTTKAKPTTPHIKTDKTTTPPCQATLRLKFDNNSARDVSVNKFKVINSGVTFKDGYAYFDGKAKLSIPGFSSMEVGSTLIIFLQYNQANSSASQLLVSNGGDSSKKTLAIFSRDKAVDFYVKTVNNGRRKGLWISVPRQTGSTDYVRYSLEDGRFRGFVSGNHGYANLPGSVARLSGSLDIGGGPLVENFQGKMYEFVVHRCSR